MSIEDTRQILSQLSQLRTQIAVLEARARQTFINTPTSGLQKSFTVTIKKTAHGLSVHDPVDQTGTECLSVDWAYFGIVSRVFSPDEVEITLPGGVYYSDSSPSSTVIGAPYITFVRTYPVGDPDTYVYATAGVRTIIQDNLDDSYTVCNSFNVDVLRLAGEGEFVWRTGGGTLPPTSAQGDIMSSDGMSFPSETTGVSGILWAKGMTNGGTPDDAVLLQLNKGSVNYVGTAPSIGDALYLSATPGKVTADAPVSPAVPFIVGRALSGGVSGKVGMEICKSPVVDLSSDVTGLLPLKNGGTGRDFTAVTTNAVVYKYDATTLGGTINPSGPGVLTQAASSTPYFLASTTNSTVIRRNSSGGLEWGKVNVTDDLSGPVPQANGGLGNDVSAVTTNAVWYKSGANTSGGTINSSGTLGALVQSSSGVPYFLNFDAGNTMDVSGGNIKSAICTKISNYATVPSYNMDLLKYNTSSQKWEPFRIITTKGDISTTDGTDFIRLPVGTNGQVLVADSTQSSGLKWASSVGQLLSGSLGNGTLYSKTTDGSYSFTTTKSIVAVRLIGGGGGGSSSSGIAGSFYAASYSGGSTTYLLKTVEMYPAGSPGASGYVFLKLPIGTVVSGTVGARGAADTAGTATTLSFTISSTTYTYTADGGPHGGDPTGLRTRTLVATTPYTAGQILIITGSQPDVMDRAFVTSVGLSYTRYGMRVLFPNDAHLGNGRGGHSMWNGVSASGDIGGHGAVDAWEMD